jgi:hypothetical protein
MPAYFLGAATFAGLVRTAGRARTGAEVSEGFARHPAGFRGGASKEFGKWFDAELVEYYVEGLRKAGLEVVDQQDVTETRWPQGCALCPRRGAGCLELASSTIPIHGRLQTFFEMNLRLVEEMFFRSR